MQIEDQVQVRVKIDGKQGINELGKYEMALHEAHQAAKGLKSGTDKYIAAHKKIDEAKAKVDQLREKLGNTGMTMGQLQRKAKDLRRELTWGATQGTERYAKLEAQLQEVNGILATQRARLRGTNKLWRDMKSGFAMFGPVALLTTAIYGAINAVNRWVDRNIRLSETLADVEKNTGLTKDQVDDMTDSLMDIDTKSSRQELLELSIIAGKLGIEGQANIEGFVRAADKINVALGEDLGDGTQALRKLGKLVETYPVKDAFGIEESMLRVGSAVNTLGRSSTAAEGNIVEFTRRMGGIAPKAKVSIADTLGLGAATDALGVSMEVGATAIGQIYTKMTDNRGQYVRFARDTEGNQLSLEQFTHMINNDFNNAFLAVLRGLNENSDAMTTFIDTLGDMELEGERVKQTIGALSGNLDVVTRQQAIANEEFEKGTSIIDEFNLKNETAGANLTKVWKAFGNWFINSSVVRGFEKLTGYLADLVEVPVSESLARQRSELNVLVGAIQRVNDNEEVRNKLITDLQSKYPDFLKNLDTENLTNDQLAKALERVNEEYAQKIILAAAEEEITEIMARQVELVSERMDLEKKLQEQQAKSFEAYNSNTRISASAFETRTRQEIEDTQAAIEEANLKIEEQVARRNALLAEFGVDAIATPTGADGNNNDINTDTTTTGTTPSRDFALDPLAKIDKTASVKEQRKQREQLEEQYQYRLEKAQEHGVALIGLAETVMLTTTDIDDERTARELDNAGKRRDINRLELNEKIDAYQQLGQEAGSFFEGVGDLFNAFGQNQREFVGFQIAGNFASILADQGAALAAATRQAAGTSFTPIDFAVKLAALATAIITQIANAKRMIDQAKESVPDPPSFYFGGWTGTRGLGFGDRHGEFTGYTHKNELVLSENQLRTPTVVLPTGTGKPPAVVDVSAINDTATAGLRFSSPSSTDPRMMDATAARMEAAAARQERAAERMEKVYGVLFEKGIDAHFSRNSYRDAKEDDERFQANKRLGDL